jgi:3-dehydroquinate dehydratase-2
VKLLILNGPNLDLLGTREPETYGSTTLAQVGEGLDALAATLHTSLRHVQCNDEGGMLLAIRQASRDGFDGAIVNAAGFTHTSVVLRDVLLATRLPFIEVHISNVHAREAFRHRSLLADVASGVITGLGVVGYELALRGLVHQLSERR